MGMKKEGGRGYGKKELWVGWVKNEGIRGGEGWVGGRG